MKYDNLSVSLSPRSTPKPNRTSENVPPNPPPPTARGPPLLHGNNNNNNNNNNNQASDRDHHRDRNQRSYDKRGGSGRRSRSRSPAERRRRRSRSRSRSPRRTDSQSRSPSDYTPRRRRDDNNPPSCVILMRGLPENADENTLWLRLLQDQYTPVDIRVMRNKDTGQNRGFGFVEFGDVADARKWMETSKGVYKIDDRCYVELQYSNSAQTRGGGGAPGGGGGASARGPPNAGNASGNALAGYGGNTRPGDWLCANCQVVNFKYRDRCFKCARDRGMAEQPISDVPTTNNIVPTDSLLFTNLPWNCVEEDIRGQLRRVSTLEPVSISINTSKGEAKVQMRSVADATKLYTTLTTMTKLVVGLNKIDVEYAENSISSLIGKDLIATSADSMTTSTPIGDNNTNAAAELALIAMQKANLIRQSQQNALNQQIARSVAVSAAQQQAAITTSAAGLAGLLPAQGMGMLNPQTIAMLMQQKQLQHLTNAAMQQQQLQQLLQQQQVMVSSASGGINAQTLQLLVQQPQLAAQLPNNQQQLLNALAAAQAGGGAAGLMGAPPMVTSAGELPKTTSAKTDMAGKPVVTAGSGALGTVHTPYGELPIYPSPDTSTYQFEPTSGYYFDPGTGLYYDGNSRLYYNGDSQKWLYWDAQYKTYLPVEDKGTPDNPLDAALQKSKKEQNAKEEEERKDKEDKAKKARTAKQIQKDMERWARQQNKVSKSSNASSSAQPAQAQAAPVQTSGSTASDIGFSVLEKTALSKDARMAFNAPDSDDEEVPTSSGMPKSVGLPALASAPIFGQGGAGSSAPHQDDEDVDYKTLACLLCRRKFPSADVLEKHVKMSKLHKENMEAKYKSRASSSAGSTSGAGGYTGDDTLSLTLQYRDRAKERRDKFGIGEPIRKGYHPKDRYASASVGSAEPVPFEQPTVDGIKEDNVGNKLLSKMGWKAGQGLGRSNQGIVDPIQAELRNDGVGLGARGGAAKQRTMAGLKGDEYKATLLAAMRERYADLEEKEVPPGN